jgi:hypothetical protein
MKYIDWMVKSDVERGWERPFLAEGERLISMYGRVAK